MGAGAPVEGLAFWHKWFLHVQLEKKWKVVADRYVDAEWKFM